MLDLIKTKNNNSKDLKDLKDSEDLFKNSKDLFMAKILPTNRNGDPVRPFVEVRVSLLEKQVKLLQERILILEKLIKNNGKVN